MSRGDNFAAAMSAGGELWVWGRTRFEYCQKLYMFIVLLFV